MPCRAVSIPAWTLGSPTVPLSRTVRSQVHSSIGQTPLQSSYISATALAFRFEQLPAGGSDPHVTSLRCGELARNISSPATCRPQAISASRRIAPLHSLRAYFIPQPRSGLFPFRGFSLYTAFSSSSKEAAPMSLERTRWPTSRPPQIRSSTSRPYSVQSSVHSDWLLHRPELRSPLRVWRSPRFPASTGELSLPEPMHSWCYSWSLDSRKRQPWLFRAHLQCVTSIGLDCAVSSAVDLPELLSLLFSFQRARTPSCSRTFNIADSSHRPLQPVETFGTASPRKDL